MGAIIATEGAETEKEDEKGDCCCCRDDRKELAGVEGEEEDVNPKGTVEVDAASFERADERVLRCWRAVMGSGAEDGRSGAKDEERLDNGVSGRRLCCVGMGPGVEGVNGAETGGCGRLHG